MKAVFEQYLPKLELREILPGRMRYNVIGLADELREQGAKNLTCALTGAWFDQEEQLARTASILKMGFLSTETRILGNISQHGLSNTLIFSGGADSVFTQLVPDNSPSFGEYFYPGKVRFLISLDAIESGTYQYHDDDLGVRNPKEFGWFDEDHYLNRPNIIDFVNDEHQNFHFDNEVMIKERIPPHLIEGILVQNNDLKLDMMEHLRKTNIIQLDSSGNETILSRPAKDFIQVDENITDSWW